MNKNKIVLVLFCFLLFPTSLFTYPAGSSPTTKQEKKIEYTVYITRTGHRYHRDGCRYLRQSQIPVTKGDAIGYGYTPCKICNP